MLSTSDRFGYNRIRREFRIVFVALALAVVAVPDRPALPVPEAIAESSVNIAFRPVSATSATLIVRSESTPRTIEIKTIDDTLALLADRRLASLWPQITAWAGPGLEQLRDNTVQSARAVFAKGRTKDADSSLASVVRPKLRPAFMLADALRNAGRVDEATNLMETVHGAAPQKGTFGATEWTATSIWLAKAQYEQGDTGKAIAILEAAIPPMGDDRAKVNLEVNRAARLLDMNRPDEALAAVDAAQAGFAAPSGAGLFTTGVRIRGSDRQFAWIRACALSRLGRQAEATAAAALLNTGIEPQEKRFVIDPTIKLRRQLARCTRDVASAAQAYADSLAAEPVGGDALLELQPRLQHPDFNPAFMDEVRRHPALAPMLATRMRPLPDDLVPALNGWRAPAYSVAR